MRTTQEIVESIDGRLRELHDEIKTLDAARVALDGQEERPSRPRPDRVTKRGNRRPRARSRTKTSAPPARATSVEASAESAPSARKGTRTESAPRARTCTRTTSRARARGLLNAISADRVESALSENGGLTTSALAEKTGGSRDHVLRLLRELETAGRVRRTGQRRGTRWQMIT